MKKAVVYAPCEEEKLQALKLYLGQKGLSVETELEKSVENLFEKTVPASVRAFLSMKTEAQPSTPKEQAVKQADKKQRHDEKPS